MGKNRKRKRQKLSLHQTNEQAVAVAAAAATVSGGRLSSSPALLVTPHGALGASMLEDQEQEHEHEHDEDDEHPETLKVLVPTKTGGVPLDVASCSISDLDLEVTVRTLERIVSISSSFRLEDKRFKALRCALHPLVLQQVQKYAGGLDYRMRVTQALQVQKWADALAALQACRDMGQHPKQGTIQRWVRDCDLAPNSCKLTLLNAILTVNQPPTTPSQEETVQATNKHDPRRALANLLQEPIPEEEEKLEQSKNQAPLTILEDWSIGRLMDPTHFDEDIPIMESLKSRVLYQESARQRKPPNHFDLLLHTTTTMTTTCPIVWNESPPSIVQHMVPFSHLPLQENGATLFLLENVLTVEECQQLRSAATTLGFRPDHPLSAPQPTGIDSCEWMVDDSMLQVLNDRVQKFFEIQEEAKSFVSINPRWRFFRYGQGCVYRPHLDGSWPASRIQNGKYESYEEDEEGNRIQSSLTFLMYLNDNFQGGATRFYGSHAQKGLMAQGVTPKCGSVLVFSQGNTASLIHEGSAVTQGTKYVIRTDVLYRTKNKSIGSGAGGSSAIYNMNKPRR